MNLSAEQRAIIESDLPRFLVRAGAGSGKTTVLTRRYLRFVEQGINPDRILTITFTRRAAYDMKTRIVNALTASGHAEAASLAETGPIQTIHSFYRRILSENALVAGLDPEFQDIRDAVAKPLAWQCLHGAATDLSQDDQEINAILRDLSSTKRDGRRFPTEFEKLGLEMMDRARNYMAAGINPWEHLNQPEAMYQAWCEAFSEWMGTAFPLPVDNIPQAKEAAKPKKLPHGLKASLVHSDDHREDFDGPDIRRTQAWMRILKESVTRLNDAMWERQEFDQTALEGLAVDLVQTRPFVQARLSHQFDVLFVDEAQDLSRAQHRLLEAMPIGHKMYVGDAQQSIYFFRQADPEGFQRQADVWPTLSLAQNFRSGVGIQTFVDDVFRRVWGPDYLRHDIVPEFDLDADPAPRYEGVELWTTPQGMSYAQSLAQQVEALKNEGFKLNEIAVLANQHRMLGQVAQALDQQGIPRRVAGRHLWSRLESADIQNLMGAVSDPRDDFVWFAFLRSPFVGLSLDAVMDLANRKHIATQLETYEPQVYADRVALQTFWDWFRPLRQRADRMAAWEVLGAALEKSPYMVNIATLPRRDQILANVRKLLVKATTYPDYPPRQFAEAIRDIHNYATGDSDADTSDADAPAVQLRTIHSSKGLEFDAAIVLWGSSRPSYVDSLVYSVEGNLWATGTKEQAAVRALHDQYSARLKEESKRLLYVGMTRARHRLCLMPTGNNYILRDALEPYLADESIHVRRGTIPDVE